MALLNSRLLSFRFRFIGKLKGGGVLEFFWNSISKLPIRRINMDAREDRIVHDGIVDHVTQAIDLSEQISDARTNQDREIFERQLKHLEDEIDSMVYRLYGLTDQERKTVESALSEIPPTKSKKSARSKRVPKGAVEHPKEFAQTITANSRKRQ